MVSQLQKNLINFILGGAMVVGISNLALYVNSTASALLWSFPILSIPAFIYIYLEKNDRKLLLDLNSDIIIFFFVNLTFFGFIYCLVQHTNLTIPQVLSLALLLYLIVGFITYMALRKIRGLSIL
jgi:hypothetical protein